MYIYSRDESRTLFVLRTLKGNKTILNIYIYMILNMYNCYN
jgi:hypothetical protein